MTKIDTIYCIEVKRKFQHYNGDFTEACRLFDKHYTSWEIAMRDVEILQSKFPKRIYKIITFERKSNEIT